MEWEETETTSILRVNGDGPPLVVGVRQVPMKGAAGMTWVCTVAVLPAGEPGVTIWRTRQGALGFSNRESAKDAAMYHALSWLRAQVAGLENMARRVPLVPGADDCARPPRDICEGAMTATAERLLWPPPAMCEGEPIWRIGTGGVGVWSTLPVLTRIRLAVLMEPCRLGWVAVYSGPPVEALRPVCDGRAQAHEECFGEGAV